MSKLFELIKQAEQSQKHKEQQVEQEIKARLNKLESDFTSRLEQSFGRINNDLRQQGEKVNQRLLNLYKIPAYCVGGIILILCLAVLYLTHLASNAWEDMREWKKSAELYKAQSQNIVFSKCTMDDKTTRMCVQVDPKYKD